MPALLLQGRTWHSWNCPETVPSREIPQQPSLLLAISPSRLAPEAPPSLQLSQTQAVLSFPLALFAEGIKVLLGKPPLCSDNCLQSQL